MVSKQTATVDGNGFYTINLDQPVNLRPGDTYTIVQTVNGGSANNYLPVEIGYLLNSFEYIAVSNPGESYISCDGQWLDVSTLKPFELQTQETTMKLTLGNAMIKAYTNDRQENAADDVIAMIQNLPEITGLGAVESDVVKVRDAYDALTEDLKAQVYNLNLLEAAETQKSHL